MNLRKKENVNVDGKDQMAEIIKLTEDDKRVFTIFLQEMDGQDPDVSSLDILRFRKIINNFQQILDDHEKAKKWDYWTKTIGVDWNHIPMGVIATLKAATNSSKLEQENKQLKETQLRTDNYVMKLQQKLEKIKELTKESYYGDGIDLNNELKEILEQESKEKQTDAS